MHRSSRHLLLRYLYLVAMFLLWTVTSSPIYVRILLPVLLKISLTWSSEYVIEFYRGSSIVIMSILFSGDTK
jgi:hypothetical protein